MLVVDGLEVDALAEWTVDGLETNGLVELTVDALEMDCLAVLVVDGLEMDGLAELVTDGLGELTVDGLEMDCFAELVVDNLEIDGLAELVVNDLEMDCLDELVANGLEIDGLAELMVDGLEIDGLAELMVDGLEIDGLVELTVDGLEMDCFAELVVDGLGMDGLAELILDDLEIGCLTVLAVDGLETDGFVELTVDGLEIDGLTELVVDGLEMDGLAELTVDALEIDCLAVLVVDGLEMDGLIDDLVVDGSDIDEVSCEEIVGFMTELVAEGSADEVYLRVTSTLPLTNLLLDFTKDEDLMFTLFMTGVAYVPLGIVDFGFTRETVSDFEIGGPSFDVKWDDIMVLVSGGKLDFSLTCFEWTILYAPCFSVLTTVSLRDGKDVEGGVDTTADELVVVTDVVLVPELSVTFLVDLEFFGWVDLNLREGVGCIMASTSLLCTVLVPVVSCVLSVFVETLVCFFGNLLVCWVVEWCWKLLLVFLLEEMVIWSFDCFGRSLESPVVPALVLLSVFNVSFRTYCKKGILTAIANIRRPKRMAQFVSFMIYCSQTTVLK